MKRKTLIAAIILIAAAIIIFYFDKNIVEAVSLLRSNALNSFFLGITYLSSEIVVFIFLTALFFVFRAKRKFLLPLWLTLLLSAIISFILKFSIQRVRPYQIGIVFILPALQSASHLIWNYSFPSFSTMLVFSAAPLIAKHFPKMKNVWWVFAALVAFSRVYFGVHYLSDVLAGAVIGCAIGVFAVEVCFRKFNFAKALQWTK